MATATKVLTSCNTVALTASVPLRLLAPVPGRYTMNIFNLGPGNLFYRFDGDASVNDPMSVMLPANVQDNQIHVDGVQGICVVSDQTGSISIRAAIS